MQTTTSWRILLAVGMLIGVIPVSAQPGQTPPAARPDPATWRTRMMVGMTDTAMLATVIAVKYPVAPARPRLVDAGSRSVKNSEFSSDNWAAVTLRIEKSLRGKLTAGATKALTLQV